MKYISLCALLLSLFCSQLVFADSTDAVTWKHYVRGGWVEAKMKNGSLGYYRLNRRTSQTFRDLRLFAYELDRNSFVYLRYKSSVRFRTLPMLYNFTTLSFRRNTRAGVLLRYHYNQGVGVFLLDYKTGHINSELAQAFDMSDYLNDTRKTSYVKGGLYWDNDTRWFSTKLEVEYFYQISEVVEANQTRTQLMAEVIVPVKRRLSIILGYEMEVYPGTDRQDADSRYLLLGWKQPLAWKL